MIENRSGFREGQEQTFAAVRAKVNYFTTTINDLAKNGKYSYNAKQYAELILKEISQFEEDIQVELKDYTCPCITKIKKCDICK